MRIGTGTEGPRAPLFLFGLLVSLAAPAASQTVDLAELRQCAALATGEEKLACFEALAAGEGPAAAAGPAVTAPSRPNEADETAPVRALAPALETGAAAAAATVVREPAAAPPEPVSVEAGPATAAAPPPEPASVEAAPATAAAPPPEPAAAAEEPGDEFGRRYVEAPAPDDEARSVRATISEVSEGRHGTLYFHFANGQLWRQMEGGRFPYPKDGPFEVEIRQGMMGDYQLRVGGKGRMTRIVRVR